MVTNKIKGCPTATKQRGVNCSPIKKNLISIVDFQRDLSLVIRCNIQLYAEKLDDESGNGI